MPSSNSIQANQLLPGPDKVMQGYTGSFNREASVYGNSQPTGPSPTTTQECVLSPASSSIPLFAHCAHAAINQNPFHTGIQNQPTEPRDHSGKPEYRISQSDGIIWFPRQTHPSPSQQDAEENLSPQNCYENGQKARDAYVPWGLAAAPGVCVTSDKLLSTMIIKRPQLWESNPDAPRAASPQGQPPSCLQFLGFKSESDLTSENLLKPDEPSLPTTMPPALEVSVNPTN
ncbi:hypothetical protein DSO57_1032408 [Entomophthora muscae]|uniref:Uncharacterized protein n=1 Tax=Entomophthora muscae TaxID=34485 RepID=A0ACC2T0K8_9FUNG|nr:hypothetical protein DSO57_1032408 [Entomophthora muscae]